MEIAEYIYKGVFVTFKRNSTRKDSDCAGKIIKMLQRDAMHQYITYAMEPS